MKATHDPMKTTTLMFLYFNIQKCVRDLWLIYVSKQGIRAGHNTYVKIGKDANKSQIHLRFVLKPSYHLVFLYLGCSMLRLPVLLSDVIKQVLSPTSLKCQLIVTLLHKKDGLNLDLFRTSLLLNSCPSLYLIL